MILDSLKSFERYITLHERFGKVYEFIKSHDLHSLEDGKHVIEEDNIWCTVSTSEAPRTPTHRFWAAAPSARPSSKSDCSADRLRHTIDSFFQTDGQ